MFQTEWQTQMISRDSWYMRQLLVLFLVLGFSGIGLDAAWGQDGQLEIVQGDAAAFASRDERAPSNLVVETIPSGVFWIRLPLTLSDQRGSASPPTLVVNLNAAFEVYWDGALVGRSGSPGISPEQEVTGNSIVSIELRTEEVRAGPHFIAIRASNWRLSAPERSGLQVELLARDAAQSVRQRDAVMLGAISFAGLLVATFFLWTALGPEKQRSNIMYTALAFASVAIVLLAQWPNVLGMPYHLGFERQVGLILATLAILAMLTAILLDQLQLLTIPRALLLAGGVFAGSLVSWPFLDVEHDVRVFGLLALVAIGLSAWRFARLKASALVVGVVSTLFLLAILLDPMHLNLFLFAIVLLVSAKAAIEFRQAALRAVQSEASASRLELELVKRSIQPHFLMNTLAATQELIETAPARASSFVDALAAEFQSLLGLLGRDMVPLAEEITLCSRYLSVMGLRLERTFTLRIEGDVIDVEIPPGILHALVENSFSHGAPQGEAPEFVLEVSRSGARVGLVLSAPLAQESTPSPMSSGSGMKYVKARLKESFGCEWQIDTVQQGDRWITTIAIG